jgi:hypothetical protein
MDCMSVLRSNPTNAADMTVREIQTETQQRHFCSPRAQSSTKSCNEQLQPQIKTSTTFPEIAKKSEHASSLFPPLHNSLLYAPPILENAGQEALCPGLSRS